VIYYENSTSLCQAGHTCAFSAMAVRRGRRRNSVLVVPVLHSLRRKARLRRGAKPNGGVGRRQPRGSGLESGGSGRAGGEREREGRA
jgi:hypothetical protein